MTALFDPWYPIRTHDKRPITNEMQPNTDHFEDAFENMRHFATPTNQSIPILTSTSPTATVTLETLNLSTITTATRLLTLDLLKVRLEGSTRAGHDIETSSPRNCLATETLNQFAENLASKAPSPSDRAASIHSRGDVLWS